MQESSLSVITLLLVVFCIGIPGPRPVLADEFILQKQPMRLIEVEQGDDRYWYDDRVPEAEAKTLLAYFSKKTEHPVPSIYAVPGAKGYYVVSSYDRNGTDSDYGRRLYLVRKGKDGFEDIDRTSGAADSYVLKPVFFTGRGKVLILAEIGTEYSWGLMVYAIAHKRLTFLGSLDASVEREGNAEDPTPFATVKYANGRWRVEFSHDLVLDAGGLTERTIRQKGKRPIVFEHDGKRFSPKAGTFSVTAAGGSEHAR